jgi:hypothetical protein
MALDAQGSVAIGWSSRSHSWHYVFMAREQVGARRHGGYDRIKLRTGRFDRFATVHVLINGTDLLNLWRKAGQDPRVGPVLSDFIGPGLAWWALGDGDTTSGYRDESFEERCVPEGYVPVLFCSCGNFCDGGAIARIVVEHERVAWTDFQTVSQKRVEALGPFTFRRKQYEYALSHPTLT